MKTSAWLLTLVAGSLALTLTLGQYEEKKDLDADEEDALQLLNIISKSREPKAYHTVLETDFGSRPLYFSWNDCGSSSDVAHIQSFSLSPDPLRLPGNITVGFKWKTTIDLKSPISMDMKLEKKIAFLWITVPCDKLPGTCHHANICADLASVTCPSEYETCHCPFKQGVYSLTSTSIAIQQGGVPSGDYRLTAWMKEGSKELGCFHIQLAVA